MDKAITDLILKEIRDNRKEVIDLRIAVAQLKIKASLWGLMAGSIPHLLFIAVFMVKQFLA